MIKGRTISRRTTKRIVVIAVVVALIATGILLMVSVPSADDPDLPKPAGALTRTETPTSTPTQTPTPTISEEEAAEAAAKKLPQKFQNIYADVRSDPETAPDKADELEKIADGPALKQSQANANDAPYTQSSQDGAIDVLSVGVLAVDLDNDRGIKPDGPSIVLHVCTDPTSAKYTRGGVEWEPPNKTQSSKMELRNYDYPDADGWRVWNIEESDESC